MTRDLLTRNEEIIKQQEHPQSTIQILNKLKCTRTDTRIWHCSHIRFSYHGWYFISFLYRQASLGEIPEPKSPADKSHALALPFSHLRKLMGWVGENAIHFTACRNGFKRQLKYKLMELICWRLTWIKHALLPACISPSCPSEKDPCYTSQFGQKKNRTWMTDLVLLGAVADNPSTK